VVVVRVLLDFEENNRFEGNNYKVHARDLAAGLSIRAKCIYKAVTQHNQIRKSSFITHKLVSGHGKHANSHNFI